jgi:hypothetical protein
MREPDALAINSDVPWIEKVFSALSDPAHSIWIVLWRRLALGNRFVTRWALFGQRSILELDFTRTTSPRCACRLTPVQ